MGARASRLAHRTREAVRARLRAASGGDAGTHLPRADLRLIAPALLAWAAAAALLGGAAPLRLGLGAVSAIVGCVLAGRRRATRAGERLATDDRGRAGPGFVAVILLLVGLTLLASGAHGLVRDASRLADIARLGQVVLVEGEVAREPVRVAGRGGPTHLLLLEVLAVTHRGQRWETDAVVLVRGDNRWAGLTWRSRVVIAGRLTPTDDPATSEVAVLAPFGDPRVAPPDGLVFTVSDRLREGLRRSVESLPPDGRGLLPALVVGDTSRLPTPLLEDMRVTGMTHLSAVSGTNTTLILLSAMSVAGWCGLNRRRRSIAGLVALAAFVVLARPEPSVIRAAVMGAIGVVGLVSNRTRAGPPLLGGAIVILLCVDPWLARSYGFVLSALATLGLIVFARPWSRALEARLPSRLRGWGLGTALAVPAAASLVCAPVIVLLQGAVSLVGILANALAAPLVFPATIAGVVATLVAPLGAWLTVVPVWIGGAACLLLAEIAHRGAAVPHGSIPWDDGPLGAFLLLGVSLLIVLCGRWAWDLLERRPIPVLGSLLVVIVSLVPIRPALWPPADWVAVACDVGQGDGLVLRSGSDRAVVVDVGPDPVAMDACLDRLGIRHLDAVVLTHFHADHVTGLPGALDGRPADAVLTTPVLEPADGLASVDATLRAESLSRAPVWAGDTLHLGEVDATVLWPRRRISAGSVPNNASLVLDVRVAGLRMLLLGDVEREADAALAPALAQGTAFDVVKVAHHGSANLDGALWDRIRGRLAVISVGADNDYGHPAPATLAMLQRRGYAIWRTDRRGDIAVVRSDGGVGVLGRTG